MGRTVVFAGGGTGGHLFPGISVARRLGERGVSCVFVGMGTDVERRVCDSEGIPFFRLNIGRRRSSVSRLPMDAAMCAADVVLMMWRYGRWHPAAVVGLGGASMTGAVVAAVTAGVPVVLMEQNVLPGRATRFLSRFARFLTVPPGFRNETVACDVRVTGTPVREEVLVAMCKSDAVRRFDLDPSLPVLLVMGGSQGARSIDAAMEVVAGRLKGRPLQVIHLCGRGAKGRLEGVYRENGVTARVFEFLRDMGPAYAASDLVVSRAGGSTVAELAAVGRPAILVPFPHAVDNHQWYNAVAVAETGGAIVLEEREGWVSRLTDSISMLMDDEDKVAEMAALIRRYGVRDAADAVALHVWEVVRAVG